MTDRLTEIEHDWQNLSSLGPEQVDWLIAEVKRLLSLVELNREAFLETIDDMMHETLELGSRFNKIRESAEHYGHQDITNNLDGTVTCAEDGLTFEDA